MGGTLAPVALALYRKYRPSSFGEVVGQDHVTEPLRTALAAGRINHAYLFSGPRGCGKTSSARIMARSLNCVEGPTPEPCGVCGPCVALAPGGPGSVDVTELDAASHNGVDDARELRDRAFYAPAESRYRVFVIDEAHMVTPQGFNALLKIVEEPPEHLIFIFATTEPDKVLATIRSRTHHYPFRLIPPSAMRELLERNVAAEEITVEPAVYPLVIRAGGGSARDTQSVLDQLIAGAGPDGVTYERAVALLGVTDVALIDAMVDALAAQDARTVYGTVERLAEAGHDPRRFASDLLDRLRDLVLLRSVPDAAESGLVSAPEEQIERMVSQSRRIEPGTLTRYAEILHNGLLDMRGATSPRLVLELLCARMLLPEVSGDEAAMLQRLESLERRLDAGDVAPPQTAPPAAQSSAPQAPAPQEPTPQEPTPQEPTPQAPAGAPAAPPERVYERPSQRAARESNGHHTGSGGSGVSSDDGSSRPQQQAQPQQAQSQQAQSQQTQSQQTRESQQTRPGQVDAAGLRQYWPQVLATVRTMSRSTEALLTGASVHSVEGSTVILTHPAEPLVRRLSEQRNIECIATALGKVVSGDWHVRCVHPSAAPAPEGQASAGGQGTAAPIRNQGPHGGSAPGRAGADSGGAGATGPRTYQRPSERGGDGGSRRPAPATTEPDVPLPPEPEDEPYPPDDGDPGPATAPPPPEAASADRAWGAASPGPAPPPEAVSLAPPPEAVSPGPPAEGTGHGTGAASPDAANRARALLTEHLGARPLD